MPRVALVRAYIARLLWLVPSPLAPSKSKRGSPVSLSSSRDAHKRRQQGLADCIVPVLLFWPDEGADLSNEGV